MTNVKMDFSIFRIVNHAAVASKAQRSRYVIKMMKAAIAKRMSKAVPAMFALMEHTIYNKTIPRDVRNVSVLAKRRVVNGPS